MKSVALSVNAIGKMLTGDETFSLVLIWTANRHHSLLHHRISETGTRYPCFPNTKQFSKFQTCFCVLFLPSQKINQLFFNFFCNSLSQN